MLLMLLLMLLLLLLLLVMGIKSSLSQGGQQGGSQRLCLIRVETMKFDIFIVTQIVFNLVSNQLVSCLGHTWCTLYILAHLHDLNA